MVATHRWLPLLAVLVGCSTESATNAPGGAIPLERLDEELARAQCELLFRCCDTSKLFKDAPSATRADCEARLAPRVAEDIAELQPAIAAGALTYDGAAARKCVDSWATVTCGASTESEACDRVTTGARAAGQPCERSYECATRYCNGTCQPLPRIGEPCEDACVDGAYCDWKMGKCVALLPNGASCEGGPHCESGNCDWKTSVCADRKPLGAPCTSADECVTGFCDSMGTATCAYYLEGLCYTR